MWPRALTSAVTWCLQDGFRPCTPRFRKLGTGGYAGSGAPCRTGLLVPCKWKAGLP